MKAPTIKLWRLANHEFVRALRAIRNHVEPRIYVERLISEREKAMHMALRGLAAAIIALLAFKPEPPDAGITVALPVLNFTIAPIYVVFVVSFITSLSLLSLVNYFVLNEFVRLASERLISRNASSAAVFVYADGGSAWSLSIGPQFRFFSSAKPHTALMWVTMGLLMGPLVLLLVFVYVELIRGGIVSAYGADGLFDIVILIASAFLLAFPLAQICFMYTSHTFKRNNMYIRWIFLRRLTRGQHPQVERWLGPPKHKASGGATS
jgi:hypothetical protein